MANNKSTTIAKPKVSKFLTNLLQDGSGIKQQRAEQLFNSASIAHSNLLNKLRGDVNNLESKLFGLHDLHPTNSTDLTVGGANFHPENWVNDVQNTKVVLLTKRIELKVAEETNKEWFEVA